VMAVGDAREDLRIFFPVLERFAAALWLPPDFTDLAAGARGGGFGCRIPDEQPARRHLRPGARRRTLLSPPGLAAHLRSALVDPGKKREDRVSGPTRRAAGSRARGRGQILPHRKAWKDAAPFRHQAKPELGDAERGEPAQLPSLERDAA